MSTADLPQVDYAFGAISPAVFGYRDQDGTLIWYCAKHRLAQFWADARVPLPLGDKSNGASYR